MASISASIMNNYYDTIKVKVISNLHYEGMYLISPVATQLKSFRVIPRHIQFQFAFTIKSSRYNTTKSYYVTSGFIRKRMNKNISLELDRDKPCISSVTWLLRLVNIYKKMGNIFIGFLLVMVIILYARTCYVTFSL